MASSLFVPFAYWHSHPHIELKDGLIGGM